MLVLLVLSTALYIASGQTTYTSSYFSSSGTNYYQNDILNCPNTGTCNIHCSGSSTCYGAEVNCPDDHRCNLYCGGSSSCQYIDLRCPKGSGSCYVQCTGGSSCYYSNFNWTEGNTNSLSCSSSYCRYITRAPIAALTCDVSYECLQSTIQCPDNGNCNIRCTGSQGCRYSTIIGPKVSGDLTVTCTNSYACEQATIIGPEGSGDLTLTSSSSYACQRATIIGPKESGDLSLTCSSSYSCYDANIECPAGDGSCSVSCSGSEVCVNADINWTNHSLSTFSCTNTDDCRGVTYPRPDSDAPYTVECDITNECSGNTILCPESQPCNIFCTGTSGCFGADIHCPSTHNCNIFAQGSESFHDGIVYCPESAMCNVYCTGPDGCEDAVALWAPNHFYANLGCLNEASDAQQCNILQNPLTFDPNPPNNNEIFNFVCDETKECASSVINCPTDADCIVDCHAYGSCAASTINCPINGNCYVYCLNTRACYYAKVIAPVNGELDLRCQTQSTFSYSCTGVETFYPTAFPTQIPTTAAPFTYSPTQTPTKSTVQLGIEDIQETQQDIIDAIAGLEALVASATLNITLAELRERLDYLRARVQLSPTRAPTFSPTADPTNDPTADPTMDPTDGPTRPSVPPTEAPSPAPTVPPTPEPTADPSATPTNNPTPAPVTTWIEGLTLGGIDNSYGGESPLDIGKKGFNGIFQTSDYHIIRRECGSCDVLYQDLYYKRLSTPASFDAYSYMRGSELINDNIFIDFMIYTSIETAINDDFNGAWFGCYEGPRTSAFGDCYRTFPQFEDCQYPLDADAVGFNASDPCNKPVRFSIFVGESDDHSAIANEKREISGNDGDTGYEIVNEEHDNGDLCMVMNAEQLDLVLIGVIGFVLIVMNSIVIAWKCGCCKCKDFGIRDDVHKFKSVKFDDNMDIEDHDEHQLEMEQTTQ